MAKNNFDDFLLDPTFDDLDSIHQEAERQLLRGGGFKKLVKKVKNKLTSKKKKNKLAKAAKSAATSDAQAAQIERVASTTPAGNKSTTYKKPATVTPKRKPGTKIEASKPKAKVNSPGPKKIQTKEKSFGETFKENRKMLGAGKTFTYKGKKYSTNTADDLAKKPKATTPTKKSFKPKSVGQIKTEAAVDATKKNLQKGSNITLKKKSNTKLPGQNNTKKAKATAAAADAAATMKKVVSRKTDPVKSGIAGSGVVKRTDKNKKKTPKAKLNLPKKGSMLATGGMKKLYKRGGRK